MMLKRDQEVFLRLWRGFSNMFEETCEEFVEGISVTLRLCFVKVSYNVDCMDLLDEIKPNLKRLCVMDE